MEREGYEVYECADGQEVLDRLATDSDYSAIVIDLKLPGVSGLDVLSHIRSTKTTMGMQVIVLTANADSATEIAVMEAGADDFLPKPINPDRFVARIRAAIRRARG